MRQLTRLMTGVVLAALLGCLTTGCTAKARMARHLKSADKYFAAGNYASAEIEYFNTLKFGTTNAHAIGRLGTIYYEQGRGYRAFPLLLKAVELTPDDMDLQVKLGLIYLNRQKLKEARQQANLVLDQAPRNAEAPALLAETIARTNRSEAELVRQRLAKLRAQIGETAPLQLGLGTLAFHEGDLKAAEAAFKRAVELDPKSSAAHQGLGNLSWAQTNLANADAEFKAAWALDPARSNRRLYYADFKIKSGSTKEAAAAGRQAGKQLLEQMTKEAPDYLPAWTRQAELALGDQRLADCAALLNQVLNRDAADSEAMFLRGKLSLAQNEPVKAMGEFERINSIHDAPSPQVYYHLAVAHMMDNKDTVKARKSLGEALVLAPHFEEATLLLAQIDIEENDPAAAIFVLRELRKFKPESLAAYLMLGTAYRAQGNAEQALEIFKQLAEKAPNNPEAPMIMGLIYLDQNRKAEARKAFERTHELAPEHLPTLEHLVDLDLGDGQMAAALARVQQELEKRPKLPELQLLLAKVYVARGEPDQAEKALLKAIELNPENLGAYQLLAQFYYGNHKTASALAKLNEMLARNPKDATALLLLASIQTESKDFAGAKASYGKLLEVKPDYYPAERDLAYICSEKFQEYDKALELVRKGRDLIAKQAAAGPEGANRAAAREKADQLKAYSTDTMGWIVYRKQDFPWALTLLQESGQILTNVPEVQYHLGMAYYMNGQETQARTILAKAVAATNDFNGKDEGVQRLATLAIDAKTAEAKVKAALEKQFELEPFDPVVLTRLIGIYEREKAGDKVVKVCEAALKANPKSLPAMIQLAAIYSDRKDIESRARAFELAKTAYKLAPDDRNIAALTGRLAYANKDYKWSLSLLQGAAARAKPPQDAEIGYDLALAQYSLGTVAEARKTMQGVLDKPTFTRKNEAARFVELAPLYGGGDKAFAAEARAREVLKTEPEDVAALMVAGLCAEHRGEAAAACQTFERVLHAYPEFTPVTRPLLRLYLELGEHQKAFEQATKARQAFPDDGEVARTLGVLLYTRGDFANSARLLEEWRSNAGGGGSDGQGYFYLGIANYKVWKAKKQPTIQLAELTNIKTPLQRALDLKVPANLADEARKVLGELK